MSLLSDMAGMFAQLSLVAFGGGNTILPEMERQVVDGHHWMSAQEFTQLFALAQAAPGPNLMIIVLVGWHVAGPAGALVAAGAGYGPSSVLAALVARAWERVRGRPWRAIVERGLAPLTVGLVASSAVLIGRANLGSWGQAAILAISAGLAWRTRLHPLWLLGGGALLGLTGIGQA